MTVDFPNFLGLSTPSAPVVSALDTLNAAGLDLSPLEIAGAAAFLQLNPSLAEATATLGTVWAPWLADLGTLDAAAVPQWIDQTAPTLVDVALRQPGVRDALTGGALDAVRAGLGDSDLLTGLAAELDAQLAAQGQGDRLVIIDGGVENYHELIAGVEPGVEVIVLDPSLDGVAQITAALDGRTNIASLHVLSHGDDASLNLGSTTLNLDNLNEYSALIQSWAPALKSGADVLLYGCNVGASESGTAFLQQLRNLTTADLAASDDLTGSALLGGDWEFEIKLGQIDTEGAIAEPVRRNFAGTLDTVTAVATASGINGTVTSITALQATPGPDGISLEEAVAAANNTAGDDIIQLTPGAVYTTTATLTVNGADNLTVQSGTMTDPIAHSSKARISAGNLHQVFLTSGSGDLSLFNLVIRDGNAGVNRGGGIQATSSGALNVNHSVLTANTANQGGALRLENGTLNVFNSTFHSNAAGGGGDVVSTDNTAGTVTLDHVTATANAATSDFRFFGSAPFSSTNSILDGGFEFIGTGLGTISRNIFTTGATGITVPDSTATVTDFTGSAPNTTGPNINLTGVAVGSVIATTVADGIFAPVTAGPAIDSSSTASGADQIGNPTAGGRREVGAAEEAAANVAPTLTVPTGTNLPEDENPGQVLNDLFGGLNVTDPDSDLQVVITATPEGGGSDLGRFDFDPVPTTLTGDIDGTDGMLNFTVLGSAGIDPAARNVVLNS
ncbi:MAG: DUF4347 domain-containing protein, partial [Cyanobacteria bacterium P01_H01_bin.130]